MSSISIKNLYFKNNAFGDRNISLNLRNVGNKRYVFGITLIELVFSLMIFILLTMGGGLKFIFLGLMLWGIMYFLRVKLKPFYVTKKIYKRALKPHYYPGIEHQPTFKSYIRVSDDNTE